MTKTSEESLAWARKAYAKLKNRKDIKKLSQNADAVVVGSSIIKKVEDAQKKNIIK